MAAWLPNNPVIYSKEGRVWSTVYHGREAREARTWGSWSHCISSQKAGSDECWLSAFFFFNSFWDPSPGMVVLTFSTGLPMDYSLRTLKEEKFCFSLQFQVTAHHWEKSGQGLKQKLWRCSVYDLAQRHIVFSASFLMLHRPTFVEIYI